MGKETITCYHYRAVKIPIGQDIPHTSVRDDEIPEELWAVPLAGLRLEIHKDLILMELIPDMSTV